MRLDIHHGTAHLFSHGKYAHLNSNGLSVTDEARYKVASLFITMNWWGLAGIACIVKNFYNSKAQMWQTSAVIVRFNIRR